MVHLTRHIAIRVIFMNQKARLQYSIQIRPIILNLISVIAQAVVPIQQSKGVLISGKISNKTYYQQMIQLPKFSRLLLESDGLSAQTITITSRHAIDHATLEEFRLATHCRQWPSISIGLYAIGNMTKVYCHNVESTPYNGK